MPHMYGAGVRLTGVRLTVAMIVRNEESVLAESLASVRLIADEIVVLDTGSTDQTVELARQWGAKTASTAWQDDFSLARNQCWRLASGQWVLWLDAGERLAAESALDLRSFVEAHADPNKAYLILVEIPAPDGGQSHEQAARVRLVPNRAQLQFVGRVRETLLPSIQSAGLAVDVAPGKIVRHRRDHDPARRASRAQRSIRIASAELEQSGCRPARLLLALGESYLALGEVERAVENFHEAIVAAAPGSTAMLEAYYGLLAALGRLEEHRSQRLAICLEALERFPRDAQLLLALGRCVQQEGQWELAAKAFDAAMRIGEVDLETWHPADLAETAAVCAALARSAQGQLDDARRVLEQAIANSPQSQRLARHLLEVQIRQADYRGAMQTVGRLVLPADEKQRLHVAVRGACRAAGRQWKEALADLQSAYLAGCKDTIVLRWLAAVLFQTEHFAAAEPVLADWQRIDPHDAQLQVYLKVLAREPPGRSGSVQEVGTIPISVVDAGSDDLGPGKLPIEPDGKKLRIDSGEQIRYAPPIHLPDGPTPVLPAERTDSAGTV